MSGTDGSSASSGPAVESVRLYPLLLESLSTGALVVDSAGISALANPAIERVFGYTREKLIGQAIDIILSSAVDTGPRHDRDSTTMVALRRAGSVRLVGRRHDGSTFPVDVECHPLVTEHGACVVAVGLDVAACGQPETPNGVVKEQLEFGRLLTELSGQFINLPADRVDDAMRHALGQIGEALELDLCTFFRLQPDGTAFSPVVWQRQDVVAAPTPIRISLPFPWEFESVLAGEMLCFSNVDEIPAPIDRASYRSSGIRSSVTVPLSVAGRVVGGVCFKMLRKERAWGPEVVRRLRVIATAFGNVLARRERDEALQKVLAEVQRLRDRLEAENIYLRREVKDREGTGTIVGQSAGVRRVLALVEQVAPTDSTVLLLGETGTGKEFFATRIHELSPRRGRPMVRVNCAAIPATLIESELFGRERGAFTGAVGPQVGRFELANHSTIFLDEIGDLPLALQVKLLRVLEKREVERLGSPRAIRVDMRIVAATHQNLEERIAEGAFRDDLFYRLNVFPIRVPPLRERVEDIPLLVSAFVEEFSKAFGKRIDTIPRENLIALQQYGWPGNIRELRNVIERAAILATSSRLTIPVPGVSGSGRTPSVKLCDVEREHIRGVLQNAGWRIRGPGGAANQLGMRPTTLETRMAKLGLARPTAS